MRNETVDVSRGLGILLVVLGHNWIVTHDSGEVFRIIFSFHVPLFFFLSGIYLSPSVRIGTIAKRKASSLLKPYFFILFLVALGEFFSARGLTVDNIFGIFFATGQSIYWEPMWFLPHLFLTTIFLCYILSFLKINKKRNYFLSGLVLLLGVFGIFILRYSEAISLGSLEVVAGRNIPLIGLPFSADLIFISSAYMLLGYIFSEALKNFSFNFIYLTLAVLAFSLCHIFFDETINLNFRLYGNPFVSTIQAIGGIYMVLCLSTLLSKFLVLKNFLSYIGAGSLFVLIFHGILQGKATSRLQYYFPEYLYLDAVLGLIVAVAFSLLIWEVVKRVPFFSYFMLEKK